MKLVSTYVLKIAGEALSSLRLLLCVSALALVVVACGGNAGQSAAASDAARSAKSSADRPAERRYVVPRPPALLNDPYDRLEYVSEHYWDAFDFGDKSWLADTAAMEQTFADFVGVLGYAPADMASASLCDMLRRAETDADMYRRFAELSEHYFYDPNSPLRNEELYISVLDELLAASELDSLEKLRPAYQRMMISKNRVGTVAADIVYETPNGRSSSLRSLRAPYVLLFFHDPDCATCRALTAELDRSPVLQAAIDAGQLVVLTIYPDADEQAWRNHVADMPHKGWIHGWDRAQLLNAGDIYDLRARPSLYLLDKDKRVLIKDIARVEPIEERFRSDE